jgi:rubrerythrin
MTRRDLARIAALGAAALVAGCGNDEQEAVAGRQSGFGPERDARILNNALDLELIAIAAYSAGAELLRGAALSAGRELLEHEREHAAALRRAIEDVGGVPVAPKPPDEYRRSFPRLRAQRDVLRFAVDLENTAVKAYFESLPKLSEPGLRQLAAGIVSNEAEHISVLLGLEGRPQVPDAFVRGVVTTS